MLSGGLMFGAVACEKTDGSSAGGPPPEASLTPEPEEDAGSAAPDSGPSEESRLADAGEPTPTTPTAPTTSDAGSEQLTPEDDPLRKRPRAFTPAELDTQELTALLAAHPRTQRLAKDVSYFWDPQAGIRVLGRGTNDPKGFEFEAMPKIWNPDDGTGVKFLLVMGRSGEDTSFIVVYRMTDESKATLASSFIMENEVGPLAFGFSQAVRKTIHFSSCWGCPGESGKVLLKDDGHVVIVQP